MAFILMVILRDGLNLQILEGCKEDEHSPIFIFGEVASSA